MIHSTAIIAPGAKLGDNVEIAPFAVIGEQVVIGDNCKIGPHVVITGRTTIGNGTEIHTGANIGDTPQDISYKGENTATEIGENCIIREYVTVHRGTGENGVTRVGNHVMLMAMSHLGHDCQIGDYVIIVNSTLLAGHVTVAEHATISGGVLIHQFTRIGRYVMIGGGNMIRQDVPPFSMLQNGTIHGANIIGLRRAGCFPEETRTAIQQAIKIYSGYGLNRTDAVQKIKELYPNIPEVEEFIEFVMTTKRGIMPGFRISTTKESTPSLEGESSK